MKKPSLTIGIPAHNEAKNIGSLLRQLLMQEYKNLHLDKILIYSDGSTDATVSIIRKIKSSKIKVIANPKRNGISFGLNRILNFAKSDILLLLDADISVTDIKFIEKITAPIIRHEADLVSARLMEFEPTNFYSRMLWVSQQVKNKIFETINKGDNLFNCKGPARAFSQKLYTQIVFPNNIANDAYSYVRNYDLGQKFTYVKNAVIYYRLVDNFKDHQKQSLRFFQTSFALPSAKIPFTSIVSGGLQSSPIIFRYPIHSVMYLIIQFYLYLSSFFRPKSDDRWQMASSSK